MPRSSFAPISRAGRFPRRIKTFCGRICAPTVCLTMESLPMPSRTIRTDLIDPPKAVLQVESPEGEFRFDVSTPELAEIAREAMAATLPRTELERGMVLSHNHL